MKKLVHASLLLILLILIQNQAFSFSLDCKMNSNDVEGVATIEVTEDAVYINNDLEIPLEKSRINCGNFGKQLRLDGVAQGYQVVLESCSSAANLEGHIMDTVKKTISKIRCN